MNNNQKLMVYSGLQFAASFALIIFACTLKTGWLIFALICLIAAFVLKRVWKLTGRSRTMNQPEKQDSKED